MVTPRAVVCLEDVVYFEPQEDISAYELALALPIILRIVAHDWAAHYGQMIRALPAGTQRHFRLAVADEPARPGGPRL
jgi:hypothetical protein